MSSCFLSTIKIVVDFHIRNMRLYTGSTEKKSLSLFFSGHFWAEYSVWILLNEQLGFCLNVPPLRCAGLRLRGPLGASSAAGQLQECKAKCGAKENCSHRDAIL